MRAAVTGAVVEAARRLRGRRPWRVAVAAHLGAEEWSEGASDAIYEVGSVTKVFVGTLLADLVERGLVSLDDTVVSQLPSASPRLTMTLAQLASHTSGLPRLPANFLSFMLDRSDPFSRYDEAALTAALARERPVRPPGRRHLYSNYGFAVLGHLLSRRGGASLERLVRERVCEPLGLRDTDFVLDHDRASRLLCGHTWRGQPAPHWSFGVFDAAGALKSTSRDLLTFVRAQTRAEHPLAPLFHRARAETWRGRRFGLGLGWFSSPLGADLEVWHTGATGGFASYVGFVPARDAGLVVLVDHGLSAWGALVSNQVERTARRLLQVLVAEAGRR